MNDFIASKFDYIIFILIFLGWEVVVVLCLLIYEELREKWRKAK